MHGTPQIYHQSKIRILKCLFEAEEKKQRQEPNFPG